MGGPLMEMPFSSYLGFDTLQGVAGPAAWISALHPSPRPPAPMPSLPGSGSHLHHSMHVYLVQPTSWLLEWIVQKGKGREKKDEKEFYLKHLKKFYWASLVVQWLRICLPMQGTRVRALVWENTTCHGATRPVSHNYRACASGACAPQQETPR